MAAKKIRNSCECNLGCMSIQNIKSKYLEIKLSLQPLFLRITYALTFYWCSVKLKDVSFFPAFFL